MRKFNSMCLVTGVLCAAGGALAAEQVKTQVIPNFATTDKTGWVLDRSFGVDDLLPPPTGGPGPVTFDRAHPYVPNGSGAQSTYRVADLSNPIRLPWTSPSMKKANDEVLAGRVPFRARERCWPVGVPGFSAYSLVEPFYFYQSPDKVVVINQGGPEIRRVYLNVTHSKDVKPSWYGESVGHYDGDTLVVDTIGFNDKTFLDNYRTPHTDKLHVTERWRLIEDGKKLEILMTIDDPGTFNQPWQALRQYDRVNRTLSEDICSENNVNPFGIDYGTPVADKPDF